MGLSVKEGRSISLPSYYIRQVKMKLASGIYYVETVPCYCGEKDSLPVVEQDRYGFDYRMGMCKNCGILYANPRMTAETYQRFYNDEYRKVYDDETTEDVFKNGLKQGATFVEFLSHFEIKPKVIFEIGCNTGAWLMPFKEQGAEVYGVDYNQERTEFGRSQGLSLLTGGIEQLEALGKKADLIILHHVLEHFLDLGGELARIKALLSENGTLYVGVPGLYTWDKDLLFQNAHTYQFTAATLTYLMETSGFDELYCDEHITSLWQPTDVARSRKDVPKQEIPQIWNHLFSEKRRVPQIRTVNKFPIFERRENIRKALSLGFRNIHPLIDSRAGSQAVIIGGGPSVDGEVDKIHALIERGAVVIAIERMYQWCLDNGIVPTYVVALDASEDVKESFQQTHPGVTHLVSVQCPPSVFELLSKENTYIFNTPQRGISMADLWDDHDYDTVTVINAGGSVTICAMSIAMTLGMKDLHIFGFDCHVTNGNYAKSITGVGAISHVYEVEIGERIFKTTSPYLSFAQQFFEILKMARELNQIGMVRVYGDSLVAHMSLEDING